MTDVQLYIGIGLPVIAVLASLTVSLVQISGIREDFRVQISAIREDLREVRSERPRRDFDDPRGGPRNPLGHPRNPLGHKAANREGV